VSGPLELVPVLELEPGRYTNQQYPTPSVSGREDPVGWDEHWRKSLADAGITTLKTVPEELWKVLLSDVSDPLVIRKIIEVEKLNGQARPDNSVHPEHCGTLCGGYILRESGKTLLSPQCCGDLSNIYDWVEAAKFRGVNWSELWIGHPCVSVRYAGGHLELSDYHEPGEPPRAAKFLLDADSLLNAANYAIEKVEVFRTRLLPVLRMMGFAAPESTASSLVGESEKPDP
jgi:hypothetical protein